MTNSAARRHGSSVTARDDMVLPIYFTICLLLGGASAAGAMANALLQLVGTGILFWLVAVDNRKAIFASPRVRFWASAFAMAWIGWVVLQLVPLPPAIWQALPGRDILINSFEVFGASADHWRPVALEPERAIDSSFALIPPLAVGMLALRASGTSLRYTMITLCVVALGFLAIGFLQMLQGPGSAFYVYKLASRGSMTGLFANTNHFSLMLVCAGICAATLGEGISQRKREQTAIWLALGLVLIAAVVVGRSLAGIALSMLALGYIAIVAVERTAEIKLPRWLPPMIGVAALAALMLIDVFASEELDQFMAKKTVAGYRSTIARYTFDMAKDFFPFGTGLGNFRWVYPYYENEAIVIPNYINHAHNDWLEIFVNGGIFATGIVIIGATAVFFAARKQIDQGVLGLGTGWGPWLILLAIGLHSVVDYPLRTSAIAAIASLALAMAFSGRVRSVTR